MYFYHHKLILIFLMIFSFNWGYGQKDDDDDRDEIIVAPKECLKLSTPASPSTQPMRLQFINTCQDDLFAKVCIVERDGDIKLHQSPVRIPRFGTFNLNLYPGEEPGKISWASSIEEPPTPAPCNKDTKR